MVFKTLFQNLLVQTNCFFLFYSSSSRLKSTSILKAEVSMNKLLRQILPQLPQLLTLQALQKTPVSAATQRGHWEP